jgi:hypothetical protein
MIDQNLARYLQEAMQRFHPVRTPAGDVRHLDLSSVQLEVMVAGIRVTVTVGPEEIVQAYVPLIGRRSRQREVDYGRDSGEVVANRRGGACAGGRRYGRLAPYE